MNPSKEPSSIMHNKVSIIIPVYNTELYLKRCIESILQQTYTNWELILVNDGSTDNSVRICQSYVDKYPYIRLFNLSHKGVSAARNFALSQSVGEYVCFMDSDDSIEPDFLSKMVSVFERNKDIDIVRTNFFRIIESNRYNIKYDWKGYYSPDDIISKVIPDCVGPSNYDLGNKTAFTPVWGMLIKRTLAIKVSFDESLFIMEDKLYLIELLLKSCGTYFHEEHLYNYYINPNSTLSRFSHNLIENMTQVLTKISRLLSEANYMYRERLENLTIITWWSVCYNELYSPYSLSHSIKEIQYFDNYIKSKQKLSIKKRISLIKNNITWLLIFSKLYSLYILFWRKYLKIKP